MLVLNRVFSVLPIVIGHHFTDDSEVFHVDETTLSDRPGESEQQATKESQSQRLKMTYLE